MAELGRSQREFATLVENSPFIFARFDRDLRHVYVSPTIEQVTGLPPSAFIGKTHAETGMPAALAAEWRDLLRAVVRERHEPRRALLVPHRPPASCATSRRA